VVLVNPAALSAKGLGLGGAVSAKRQDLSKKAGTACLCVFNMGVRGTALWVAEHPSRHASLRGCNVLRGFLSCAQFAGRDGVSAWVVA
jgi:hypothetical protein